MADFLALDWEQSRVYGVEAQAGKGRVRLENCFVLEWPEDAQPAKKPEAAGEWLKGQLRQQGVSSKQVVVTLPREDVVVRHLELPNTSDDELPDLVRFQASTKSSLPLDQLLLDFLPLPQRHSGGPRDVLMASVSKRAVEKIQTVLAAADLEIVSISVSSIALVELVARLERQASGAADETCLAIAVHDRRVEMSAVRNQRLMFTHSVQLPENSSDGGAQTILAEINRLRVMLQRFSPTVVIPRVWVFGEPHDHADLCTALQERLTGEIQVADPLAVAGLDLQTTAIPGSRAAYAGPAGLLLAKSEPLTETFDFLNPRRRVVKKDQTKLRIGLAAAGVLLLISLVYGGTHLKIAGLEREIESLQDDDRRLAELLEQGEPIMESAALLGQWEARNGQCLDRLHDLVETMRGTERYYLTEWRFETMNNGPAAANMRAPSHARSRADANDLQRRLAAQSLYDVDPTEISDTAADRDYPYRFELKIQYKPDTLPDETSSPGSRNMALRR